MHKNPYWLLFLGIIGAGVLCYSSMTFKDLYQYQRLDTSIIPSIFKAELKELSEDEAGVLIVYQFSVGAAHYEGSEVVAILPNTPAAEQELTKFEKQDWRVWYDSAAPSYSALKKKFPLKESISSLILWGIFLYFVCLGYYVTKRARP